jgi:NADH-quinone oxidoreductase subunit N
VPAYDQLNQAAGLIIPEIILIATVCIMFLSAPFLVTETGQSSPGLRHRWGILTLLSLGCAILAWLNSPLTHGAVGPFEVDALAWYVRGVILITGVLLTLVVWDQTSDSIAAEVFACLLAVLAGVSFVGVANDLIGIFLGLELVSIPTYILLYLGRQDWHSREATIKYFLLSIFSSALVLFGLAWVYGLAGSTNLAAIASVSGISGTVTAHKMLTVALVMILCGVSFRLTAVPFHFYAPDVFQGTTPSAAAMLSFLPKLVGFVALLQILPVCYGSLQPANWLPAPPVQLLVAVMAVGTMTIGNVMALRQKSLLRLLAWSSISHGGYMLVGLAVADGSAEGTGLAAILFYLPVYGVMSIGVFAAISAAGTLARPLRSLEDIHGLSQTRPALALTMTICLFGMSGLPPTGGFLGKLNLFVAAWKVNTELSRFLAIVLAINAVIAATYYLRVIGLMYFEKSVVSTERETGQIAPIAGLICAAATLLTFLIPQQLWEAAVTAAGL